MYPYFSLPTPAEGNQRVLTPSLSTETAQGKVKQFEPAKDRPARLSLPLHPMLKPSPEDKGVTTRARKNEFQRRGGFEVSEKRDQLGTNRRKLHLKGKP